MRRDVLLLVAATSATAMLATACGDPVHDNAVAALGPEQPGVPRGPLHRPGQPCLTCHDGSGPGSLTFGTAGTVFQDAMDPTPLVAATVQLTDIDMSVTNLQTNCAGNFFVEAVDWNPIYPLHVQVVFGSMNAQMRSHVAKTGSCATCHGGAISSSTVAQVFLNQDPMSYPPTGCQ